MSQQKTKIMSKKFGQVRITIEGVPTLNIPTTMHDAGLKRFKQSKKVNTFIKRKTKQIMATKKASASKAKKVSKSSVPSKISASEKMRAIYDANVKKLGFTETQKLIIKKGYNRNTVVPVIWKHRIAIGEIEAPTVPGGKNAKPKTAKPAAKKKAAKKAAPKKAVKKTPVKKAKANKVVETTLAAAEL